VGGRRGVDYVVARRSGRRVAEQRAGRQDDDDADDDDDIHHDRDAADRRDIEQTTDVMKLSTRSTEKKQPVATRQRQDAAELVAVPAHQPKSVPATFAIRLLAQCGVRRRIFESKIDA